MCDLDIPENSVVLNQLHIVEYMDPDGELYKVDLSSGGDGEDIDLGKAFELLEWGRAFQLMPLVTDMVLQYVTDDEEEV